MEAGDFIKDAITSNKVVLFMKGTAQFPQCGFSGQVIQILKKTVLRISLPLTFWKMNKSGKKLRIFTMAHYSAALYK